MTDEGERPAAARDDQTDPTEHDSQTESTTDGPTTDETTTPMSDIADGTTEPSRTAEPTDDTNGPNDANGPEETNGPDDAGLDRLSTDRLRGILDRVGLAALVLLALVAGWGFYSQSGTAIRTWLDPAYQPIALAVFNLAVLLVALAGVGHQLARIRSRE